MFRCEECERYNRNLDRTTDDIDNQQRHIKIKNTVRFEMKSDKESSEKDKTICTVNFDLQKILSTPRAEIGPLYYMSKLCVWNFTFFELGDRVGHCNVWNETVGCRGSTEIASFLYAFIRQKAQLGIKIFKLYSDSCGGQNKNQNVFSMYVKAANDFNVTIVHR